MPDFSWSENAGRYRDRSTGRFVPEAKVRSGVDALVSQASSRVDAAARSLRDGTISAMEFQAVLHQTIRDTHIASALAAYGGKDAMTPARWGYVGSRIKEQYQYGRKFVSGVIDGSVPLDGRIDVRAQMYAEAGRVTYEAIRARESVSRGFTEERNVLHAKESCRQCVELTSRGWVEIGSLPSVGSRLCLTRCKCTIDRRKGTGDQDVPTRPSPVEVPRTPKPGAFEDMTEALAWMNERGVYVEPTSPRPVTVELLNEASLSVAKIPDVAIKTIQDAGIRLDLLADSGISEHPSYARLKGVTPRGWPAGSSWDTVPGAGGTTRGQSTVVVVNRLKEGHGCADLILHEHGHSYDYAIGITGKDGSYEKASSREDWREVHRTAEWKTTYEATYEVESWAESFAKYHTSPTTRASLPKSVQDYFEGLG